MKYLVFFILGVLAHFISAFAYSDRIDAPAQEIYDVALTCFEEDGIYKKNPEELSLVTKWNYETIRRTRTRRFIPVRLKETVDVRYQMKYSFQEGKAYSDVSIVGWFQEKPTDSSPTQPWKGSVSDKEFYFKERKKFFELLNCIEVAKKSSDVSAVPLPSAS